MEDIVSKSDGIGQLGMVVKSIRIYVESVDLRVHTMNILHFRNMARTRSEVNAG